MGMLERPSSLKVIKEIQVNFIKHLWLYTELKTLKHSDKLFSINKLYWVGAVPYRFTLGIHCEASSSEQNPLISFTDKSSPKVPDHSSPYGTLVALALKQDLET
jgi:hypothetical protein